MQRELRRRRPGRVLPCLRHVRVVARVGGDLLRYQRCPSCHRKVDHRVHQPNCASVPCRCGILLKSSCVRADLLVLIQGRLQRHHVWVEPRLRDQWLLRAARMGPRHGRGYTQLCETPRALPCPTLIRVRVPIELFVNELFDCGLRQDRHFLCMIYTRAVQILRGLVLCSIDLDLAPVLVWTILR